VGEDVLLNVAAAMSHSHANGPGVRAVIWVQGCTIGCPGCYNAFTHAHEKRTLAKPSTIAEWVSSLEGIEGVSFSGGEPFEQAKAVRLVIEEIRQRNANLTFFSYTGYNLETLQNSGDENVIALLGELDMVSAGPYVHSKRNTELLWRGSTNQKLHYFSDVYGEHLEPAWEKASPVEEFYFDGEIIHFTGFEGRGSDFLRTIISRVEFPNS
jgi:anaerobic ribonucleoside-triphosphate reductase activating protein